MSKKQKIVELDEVVVKFAGDSGDGMQFSGNQFSNTSASLGNDLSTFPDFPSEIRAPQGTIAGVSGFTVHIGHKEVHTSGDKADVLIAMNPAALKANMKWVKPGSTIIIDIDNFDNKHYKKAGYVEDPLHGDSLKEYNLIKPPITNLTRSTLKDSGLSTKVIDKTKNQFAVGLLYFLFNRDLKKAEEFIKEKFTNKKEIIDANIQVLYAGYHYAETVEALNTTYKVNPAKKSKGKFRNITGNIATAWGFIAAAEKAALPLFLGSYPITPASEILQELSARKSLGVKTFQAEDEIAGISSTIGASFAGNLAITTTSGPGLALKSEAIGLAVMTELPIVIVNVQRGGPSTGLPTKPEQSDLMQALYGRNGESPVVVIAATTPADCFDYAYEASKIALEHMVPVILLTDGLLANSSELWPIPKMKNMPEIKHRIISDDAEKYEPYKRDEKTLARSWAIPGQKDFRHKVGGLEKQDITGDVSHDPGNHQKMVQLREEKVQRVADGLTLQPVDGESEGDLLVIGWGGSYGALLSAVTDMQKEKQSISLAQFNYIKPLPKNTEEILKGFKRIIVCELNNGQFANYLRSQFPEYKYEQYNKIQGLPFMIAELKTKFNQILEEINNG